MLTLSLLQNQAGQHFLLLLVMLIILIHNVFFSMHQNCLLCCIKRSHFGDTECFIFMRNKLLLLLEAEDWKSFVDRAWPVIEDWLWWKLSLVSPAVLLLSWNALGGLQEINVLLQRPVSKQFISVLNWILAKLVFS